MANPFFNASYYLAGNPDLYLAGVTLETAEAHYLQYGAQELAAGVPGRVGPNTWFNASFYLLSNPDLIAAGLTVADALNHYADYGVNEGRDPGPALKVADFTPQKYADGHTDVRDALGVTDTSALTPEQTSQLLSHYLAYGYIEGRKDAGIDVSVPAIPVPVNQVTMGTIANDTFTWDGAANATVHGLSGTDTLKAALAADARITLTSVESIEATLTADAVLTVDGGGVQSVSVDNSTNAFGYKGAKVNVFNLSGKGAITAAFTPSTVSGTTDALAVNLAAPLDSNRVFLTVNGIEAVNLNLGVSPEGSARDLYLNTNSIQGDTFTLTVTGGKENVGTWVQINSTASPHLVHAVIDGSAGLGYQALGINATLKLVNATITGGASHDTLTTHTAKGYTATLNGGAGNDMLRGSHGQDIMTGGTGDDVFDLKIMTNSAKADVTVDATGKTIINAVDIITDFQNGDIIKLTAAAVATDITAATGSVSATGVITFSTGFFTTHKTLGAIMDALNADTGFTVGKGVLFNFEGSAYVAIAGADPTGVADDDIIQLTGVDAAKLAINSDLVTFA